MRAVLISDYRNRALAGSGPARKGARHFQRCETHLAFLSLGELSFALTFGVIWTSIEALWAVYLAMAALGATAIAHVLVFAWRYRTRPGLHSLLVLQAAFAFWYLMPILQTGIRQEFILGDKWGESVATASAADLAAACLAVCLAKAVSGWSYLMFKSRLRSMEHLLRRALPPRATAFPLWLLAAHLGIGLVPFALGDLSIIESVLMSRSSKGLFRGYQTSGGGATVFTLIYFLSSAAILGWLQFFAARTLAGRTCGLVIACAGTTAAVLSQGTRTTMLAILAPPLSYYILERGPRGSLRRLLVPAAALLVLLIGANFLASYRVTGFHDRSLSGQGLVHRTLLDNNLYSELVYSMQVIPDQVSFSYESPILQVLTGFVPRAVWPDRPEQINREIIMRMRAGTPSDSRTWGAISAGALGQYWQVAGWAGIVVVGLWMGLVCSFVDRIITTASDRSLRYLMFVLCWSLFVGMGVSLAASVFIPSVLCLGTLLVVRHSRWLMGRRQQLAMVRRPVNA